MSIVDDQPDASNKQRRVHAQPQVAINNDFVVQIPGALVDAAIINKLTAAEWSLWLYLQRLNPFADFTKDNEPIYRSIPSPAQLAIVLGRDRKTIERAGHRLNELGLYRIRPKSWEGFNATAQKSKQLLTELRTKKSRTEDSSNNENSESPQPPKQGSTESSFSSNKNSGDYLTPSGVILPKVGLKNPKRGKNVQGGVKKSQTGQNSPNEKLEPALDKGAARPQTLQPFQKNSESTDNCAVDKKNWEEGEEEASQGVTEPSRVEQHPGQGRNRGGELLSEDLATYSPATSLDDDESMEGESEAKAVEVEVETCGDVQADEVDLEELGILDESQATSPEPRFDLGELEQPPVDTIAQLEQQAAQAQDQREVFNELRRLGVETNKTVRAILKKFERNVPAALANIRQRYNNREQFINITGAFVKACKEGLKPEGTHRKQITPPTPGQLAQLEEARANKRIRGFHLAPYGDNDVVLVDDWKQVMPWWEFLL